MIPARRLTDEEVEFYGDRFQELRCVFPGLTLDVYIEHADHFDRQYQKKIRQWLQRKPAIVSNSRPGGKSHAIHLN